MFVQSEPTGLRFDMKFYHIQCGQAQIETLSCLLGKKHARYPTAILSAGTSGANQESQYFVSQGIDATWKEGTQRPGC